MSQFKTRLIRGKSSWDSANQKQTLVTKGKSPEDLVGPAKHVPRMDQYRGIPLREGEPISVSYPRVKAKHFKCPTVWGKTIYTGAGSPYIFQATQAKPDEHLQPLDSELVSGINSKPSSHEKP
ncbi:hypothetical protein QL285_001752 [Trifolium repens]|nr:hypothetical protein QL285_001752 [Trifolium repens]